MELDSPIRMREEVISCFLCGKRDLPACGRSGGVPPKHSRLTRLRFPMLLVLSLTSLASSATGGASGCSPFKSLCQKKTKEQARNLLFCFMRKTGLEPVRCKPHAPQTCASASSATSAYLGLLRKDFPDRNFLEGFFCLWAVAHNVMYYTSFFLICQ